MKSFWVLLLVAAPLVLAEEKLKKPTPAVASSPVASSPTKIADSVASASVTEYKKTLIRKPKRSNGEIPLLIIRPVEKRRKIYFKEPTVKIASGGVATYGTYPELHTSDGEMFTLEHMLPILSLEGMLKGFGKHGPNHFVPSPQFKPSDIHHLVAPQKTKEEYHHQLAPLKPSQLLSISHKPAEAVPAQTLPSPPPPNYVPAVNSEDQLLKLGQPQPSFSPLVQDKPAFVKPEQLPASFNFKVQEEVGGHYKVNAIPLTKPSSDVGHHSAVQQQHHHHPHHYSPSAGGATSYVGSQGKPQQQPPLYAHHSVATSQVGVEHSSSKWQEVSKKPPQSVSVSTNFYHPKTIVTEQEQPQHTKSYAQPQQVISTHQQPTVQTHLSYYFPKEEQSSSSVSSHAHPQSATSYSNVQQAGQTTATTGDHHADSPVEKPIHKTYSSHIKQKYQKQHHQQPHVFIQKYFEFPSKSGASHQKNVVSEFHGSHGNETTVDHQHLPEPAAYAAPQYLPLPQPQALHQPQHAPAITGPGAQTLHLQLHHPVVHHPIMHHPVVHHHHGGAPAPPQSYWKFGRRTQDAAVKPVVEHTNEPEHADSQHAASGAVIRQVKHTTVSISSSTEPTATTSGSKDPKDGSGAQDRIDQGVQHATNGTASTGAPTRTPKQIQHGCERRCIRNTVAQSYEPVCGTDGVTYTNRGKLRCARTCGNDDLEIRSYGECPNATSTRKA